MRKHIHAEGYALETMYRINKGADLIDLAQLSFAEGAEKINEKLRPLGISISRTTWALFVKKHKLVKKVKEEPKANKPSWGPMFECPKCKALLQVSAAATDGPWLTNPITNPQPAKTKRPPRSTEYVKNSDLFRLLHEVARNYNVLTSAVIKEIPSYKLLTREQKIETLKAMLEAK